MARIEYQVVVRGADNGIVVEIGCKTLVFLDGNIDEFLADFKDYLTQGTKGYIKLQKKYFPDFDKNQPQSAYVGGLVETAPPPCDT